MTVLFFQVFYHDKYQDNIIIRICFGHDNCDLRKISALHQSLKKGLQNNEKFLDLSCCFILCFALCLLKHWQKCGNQLLKIFVSSFIKILNFQIYNYYLLWHLVGSVFWLHLVAKFGHSHCRQCLDSTMPFRSDP